MKVGGRHVISRDVYEHIQRNPVAPLHSSWHTYILDVLLDTPPHDHDMNMLMLPQFHHELCVNYASIDRVLLNYLITSIISDYVPCAKYII